VNQKIAERIPVILLSGFLGSGKTTLLNRLLQELPHSAVIVNEFGATPIDQQLLRDHKILLSVLSGGCLCCQVRDRLIPVLKNLRMTWENRITAASSTGDCRQRPFDRIIIETSGVANPESVMDILLNHRWLSPRFNVQHAITLVSAVTDEQHFDSFPEVQAQIAWADTIVITQTDLASDRQIVRLHGRLDRWAPAAPRLLAVHGAIDVNSLLAFTKQFRPLATGELPAHSYTSVTLRLEQPIAREHLENALAYATTRYREQLVRIKGMVYTAEATEPLLIQGVAGRLYPSVRLPGRSSDDGIGRLVFISDGEIKNLAEDFMATLGSY